MNDPESTVYSHSWIINYIDYLKGLLEYVQLKDPVIAYTIQLIPVHSSIYHNCYDVYRSCKRLLWLLSAAWFLGINVKYK